MTTGILKKILWALFILFCIGIVATFIWVIVLISAFGGFDKDYSVTELKKHFEKNKKEIYDLRAFYQDIVPEDKFVEIEFKDNRTLGRFGIWDLNKSKNKIYLEWNVDIKAERTDSIIKTLGWTRVTLKQLKEKLDKANCIQIENGVPTKIGFQRSGFGMYSFNIFEEPLLEEMKHKYNDSCRYILVNDTLALEYGGGAIGAQCFYNFD